MPFLYTIESFDSHEDTIPYNQEEDIDREREAKKEVWIYICIYICICMYYITIKKRTSIEREARKEVFICIYKYGHT
jgi:hypothetical protein